MTNKRKVIPNSTSIRFGEQSRILGIERSYNSRGYTDLSRWLKEAIDLRLYLEGRNVEVEYVLDGDFFSDIEILKSQQGKVDSNQSSSDLLSNEQAAETIKTLLRVHGMSKALLKVILDNPNINTQGQNYSFANIIETIQTKADDFYKSQFAKDE